jgi:hypothetical protein
MNRIASGSLLIWLAFVAGDASDRPTGLHPLSIPVGNEPRWISVADVNRDGNPDILVANAEGGAISVLLGNGNGQFHEASGSPFAAGHLPNDIAVADMNGDGNLDLVIANHQSPYVSIFLGDGKGGFHPAPGSPFDVHSSPHPHGVAVADFNSDGKPDVVTDSWGNNKIELLQGDGRGGVILPGRYFAVGRRPYERLRSADFNRDGILDIVTTNLDDGTVTILLGVGKGGFHDAPGSPFAAGAKPWQVAIDDLNHDGNPDLVVIPYQTDIADESQSAVTVLLGDGTGSFHPMPGSPLPLGNCRGPNSVTTGDLRGNGAQVIAVNCAESRTLSLFEQGSTGHFNSQSIPAKGGWGSVTLARLTKDRKSELITADPDAKTITIYSPE